MKRESKQIEAIRPHAIRPLRRFERDLKVGGESKEIAAEGGGAKGEESGDINSDRSLGIGSGEGINRSHTNQTGE